MSHSNTESLNARVIHLNQWTEYAEIKDNMSFHTGRNDMYLWRMLLHLRYIFNLGT